jgi:hypothetical protein
MSFDKQWPNSPAFSLQMPFAKLPSVCRGTTSPWDPRPVYICGRDPAFLATIAKSFFVRITMLIVLVPGAWSEKLTTEELRSDLLSAISLASETGMFIDQIESGRLLPQFRSGHAEYLRHQAERQAAELQESPTDSKEMKIVSLCREQLEFLANLLTSIEEEKDNRNLPAFRQQVEGMRKSLIAARTAR